MRRDRPFWPLMANTAWRIATVECLFVRHASVDLVRAYLVMHLGAFLPCSLEG